jgi:hypothetical protein
MDELSKQFEAATQAKPGGPLQKMEAEKVSATVGAAIGCMIQTLAKDNPAINISINVGAGQGR